MVLVQKEIKRITIRPNGTEKQIRPAGWQPGANTIAYWELNGNGNDTKNNYGVTTYTTTNYNATGYVGAGNPTYLTQRKGKYCAYFNNDRALQLPVLPIPSNNLTFSFWVNFTTIPTVVYPYLAVFQLREDVSDLGDGWALGLCTKGGGIYVRIVATTYSTGATGATLLETSVHTVSTGNWYNVVITFNAGTSKLYINGTLVETNSTNSYLRNTNSSPSYIGGWYNRKYSETEYFDGYVQDVIYENKVWSDAEVSDYYTIQA